MIVKEFKTFGTYLRWKRMQSKLSQNDVAAKLGYKSAQFISNWERGLCAPPMEALSELIGLYNLSKKEVIELILDENKKALEENLKDRRRKRIKGHA